MKRTNIVILCLLAVVTAAIFSINAASGTYGIGEPVTDFKLMSTQDKEVTLASIPNTKGYILIFTSNHCPFAKAYEDRVVALNKKYAPLGFPVVAINSNDPASYDEDSFENMKAKVKEKAFEFNYLADQTQSVAKAFGAQRTPHVFLITKKGEKLVLDYSGAIDDNSQDVASVTKRYVEDAINNILAGKPVVVTTTKAIGCGIKWKE